MITVRGSRWCWQNLRNSLQWSETKGGPAIYVTSISLILPDACGKLGTWVSRGREFIQRAAYCHAAQDLHLAQAADLLELMKKFAIQALHFCEHV